MRNIVSKLLRPYGKISFLSNLQHDAKILDVGCGNDSPYKIKSILPFSFYTGLDIKDYNQLKPNLADEYILTQADFFHEKIKSLGTRFDAVISSHNLEHCNNREATLKAMLEVVKEGGMIYLAFPCEASVKFPKRNGTLNYFDDKTHTEQSPPRYNEVKDFLQKNNFEIIFSTTRYRPLVFFIAGLLIEPVSFLLRKRLRWTWDLYGFETIFWARRK